MASFQFRFANANQNILYKHETKFDYSIPPKVEKKNNILFFRHAKGLIISNPM